MPYNRYYTEFTDENDWQYTLYILPSNANAGANQTNLSTLTSFNLVELPDDFLTERDTDEITLEYGDNFYITFLRIATGGYSAWVEVLGQGDVVTNTVSGNITLGGQFNMFNLQAGHINDFASGNIITENTYGYNFYLKRGIAQTRVIKIRHKCYPKYQQFNLEFLNRLGGWDTKKFALVNRRSSEYQRASYRRSDYQLVGGQMTNIDGYKRGRASVRYTEIIK